MGSTLWWGLYFDKVFTSPVSGCTFCTHIVHTKNCVIFFPWMALSNRPILSKVMRQRLKLLWNLAFESYAQIGCSAGCPYVKVF